MHWRSMLLVRIFMFDGIQCAIKRPPTKWDPIQACPTWVDVNLRSISHIFQNALQQKNIKFPISWRESTCSQIQIS